MNRKTVILGGGFAGRQACRAAARAGESVVLYEPQRTSVMLPALPDVAGDWIKERLLIHPLEKQLPATVQHIAAAVDAVDLDARTFTCGGTVESFDRLLIACGSRTDQSRWTFPGNAPRTLDTFTGAQRIRDDFAKQLRADEPFATVVAGGGYTGLELAASLHFRARAAGRPIRTIVIDPAPRLLPFLPEAEYRRIVQFLDTVGIELRTSQTVTHFDGQSVAAGSERFEKAFFCWAAGSTFAGPEIRGKVSRLADGRLRVLPDLSLPGYPDVFAAGDAAAFEKRGEFLRKSVHFAWCQGQCAGRNLARRAAGRATRPFRPLDAGWIIPLHAESTGRLFGKIRTGGVTGLRLHYLMCGLRNSGAANIAGFARMALTLFNEEKS